VTQRALSHEAYSITADRDAPPFVEPVDRPLKAKFHRHYPSPPSDPDRAVATRPTTSQYRSWGAQFAHLFIRGGSRE
jgi:hypothetical protein